MRTVTRKRSDWPRGADWAFFSFGESPDPLPLAVCQDEFGFSCKKVAVQADFDQRSQRFEIIMSGTYTDQGFWKYMSEHDPDEVDEKDRKKIDDHQLEYFEIGTCSFF
jgi:hypothetical protein